MSTTLSEQDTFCLASAELSIWHARRLILAQADPVRFAQVFGQNAATGNAHHHKLSDAKLLLTLKHGTGLPQVPQANHVQQWGKCTHSNAGAILHSGAFMPT